jgi:hypothetical protein
MAEPARVTGLYSCGGVYPGHVRVVVRCSCGGLTDLTYKADLPPAVEKCAECGEELQLEAVMGEMDPEWDLERERDGDTPDTAIRLLEEALHLRMNGERAPGGTETWQDWERRAETYLRSLRHDG